MNKPTFQSARLLAAALAVCLAPPFPCSCAVHAATGGRPKAP